MNGVSRAEFMRVEMERRLKVLDGVTEAYLGHVTSSEFDAAIVNVGRRNDIEELLEALSQAAQGVQGHALKLISHLDSDRRED